MCANFAQEFSPTKIAKILNIPFDGFEAHLNTGGQDVFPKKSALFLWNGPDGIEFDTGLFGILPRGTRNTKDFKYATFNAVSEEIETKRLYRQPWFDCQYCIIPASNFTEWRGEPGKKQKVKIQKADGSPLLFAGIFDNTNPEDPENGYTTISMLTTAPNKFIQNIPHHRMPVIIDDYRDWLNLDLTPDDAKKLCVPYKGELVIA